MNTLIVLCAVCDFLPTGAMWLLGAIVLPRFTIPRPERKSGTCYSHPLIFAYTNAHSSVLADENASKTGDLYIRSVCYSPDGRYLATGAEDKQIRVRNGYYAP